MPLNRNSRKKTQYRRCVVRIDALLLLFSRRPRQACGWGHVAHIHNPEKRLCGFLSSTGDAGSRTAERANCRVPPFACPPSLLLYVIIRCTSKRSTNPRGGITRAGVLPAASEHRLLAPPRWQNKIEIARLSSGEIGHLPLVDAMRVSDDPALGRLVEHFGQPHNRHGNRLYDVSQYLPGPMAADRLAVEDQPRTDFSPTTGKKTGVGSPSLPDICCKCRKQWTHSVMLSCRAVCLFRWRDPAWGHIGLSRRGSSGRVRRTPPASPSQAYGRNSGS
jgi:hypothetical protein